MTTRTLALVAAALFAPRAGAQLIKVPAPEESRRPVAVSVHLGFLQTQDRFDGQSGSNWFLGEALQYRAALEYGIKSGSIALVGSLANVPIQRSGGTAPGNSDGTIQLRQYLAAFRTAETEGAHQIIDVGLGLSQWTGYSGTDALTAEERQARNAFTLVVGYGFGFTLGDRAAFNLVQDVSTLWGSSEGLPRGRSRMVRQYTTRVGMRVMLRGRR
jgi:hypothetical protein